MKPQVDVWHMRTDAVHDAAVIEAWARVMAPEERERHQRFLFEEKRHEFLVTRGLARGVLASYVGRAPGELVFRITEYGQPLLEDAGDLRFNLTNTEHLVACAVTRGRDVGVDAEPLARADRLLDLAARVFTVAEREALDALAPPAKQRRAVELWTLKEAYMKARGLGMTLDPSRIELTFDEEGGAAVEEIASREKPAPPSTSREWAFSTREVDGHLVSVCVAQARDVSVVMKRYDLPR